VILLAAAIAAAQLPAPTDPGPSVEQRIAWLAAGSARTLPRVEWAVFDDPAMRAEIRRMGFATGCATVDEVSKSVVARHAAALQDAIAQAIRKVIPEEKLLAANVMSFLAMPLTSYQRRVEREVERSGGATLASARGDMRESFMARARTIPATANPADNEVMPKADVAAALGVRGHWDLDNPAQLAFACAEQRMSPNLRPTITTGERR
jgi:hypothetical protein